MSVREASSSATDTPQDVAPEQFESKDADSRSAIYVRGSAGGARQMSLMRVSGRGLVSEPEVAVELDNAAFGSGPERVSLSPLNLGYPMADKFDRAT